MTHEPPESVAWDDCRVRIGGAALIVAGVVVLVAEWAIRKQRSKANEPGVFDLPSTEPAEQQPRAKRMSWVQILGACLVGFGFGLLQR